MPNRGNPWIVAVVLAAGGVIAFRLAERPPRATEPVVPAPAAPAAAPPPTPPAVEVPVAAPLPPIDLRVALSAFQALAPADWKLREDTFSPKGRGGPFTGLSEEDLEVAAAAFREGASVRFESPYGHATIVGSATRFVDAPHARAFLDVARRLAEAADAQRSAWVPALPSPAYADGAGPSGSLAGFRESIPRTDRGYESLRELQVFTAGPVVFELVANDVGGLDAPRVEAAVGAAAAYVTDPARPAPSVAPLPAGVAWVRWGGLLVHVRGPDGAAVTGGAIAVIGEGPAPAFAPTEVDKGRALFPVRPVGGSLYVFGATGSGGPSEPLAPRRIPAPFPPDGRMEIRLTAGSEIVGTVVDEAGKGIADVSLAADSRAVPDHMGPLARATTGADGAFRLAGLDDEEYVLTARPEDGWALPLPRSVRGGTRDLRIELKRSRTVRLTIVDEAGTPVAGASVRVLARGGVADPRDASALEVDPTGSAIVPAYDDQGLNLVIHPPRRRPELAPTSLFRWVPREETITLHPFFSGIVRVVDESGNPARADVLIDAYEPDLTSAIGSWEAGATTNEQGLALLRTLEPRPTRVGILLRSDPDVFPVGARYAIISPARPSFTLRTARTGKTLVVRTRGGIGPQSVLLISADVHGALPDIVRSSMSNADGLATFEKVAPGAFRVFVLGDPVTGGPAGRIQIVDFTGQALEVPLVPSKAIRVHAPSTGAASSVVCSIGLPARLPLPMVRKAGDVFEYAGLPPGPYLVAVQAEYPGAAPVYAEYDVEAGATLEVRVGDRAIERVEK